MNRVTVPFFISHQGCPHTCVFCDQHAISGASGSLPDAGQILAKIASWRRSAAGRPLEVAFFGGSFTALPEMSQQALLEPLQPLLQRGELAGVRLSTRPDYIDDERVQWLAAMGASTIELGVQSMDDGVLTASGRGHTAMDSESAIRCLKDRGLMVGAQLMPGLPGDTPIASFDSLERVIAAGADFIRLYPVVVLRDTELARRYLTGEYQPLDLEAGVMLCKVLLHRAMEAGIEVVRVGLQADEGLNSETILAGCWHPALGQMVRSQLYFDLISFFGSGIADGSDIRIRCHPGRVSDVIGQGQLHLKRLAERGLLCKIKPDTMLKKEDVIIENKNNCFRYNIVTDLKYDISEVKQCVKNP